MRPPKNPDPEEEEVQASRAWLREQILLIDPS
jgi:uracil-DNA glycosylase